MIYQSWLPYGFFFHHVCALGRKKYITIIGWYSIMLFLHRCVESNYSVKFKLPFSDDHIGLCDWKLHWFGLIPWPCHAVWLKQIHFPSSSSFYNSVLILLTFSKLLIQTCTLPPAPKNPLSVCILLISQLYHTDMFKRKANTHICCPKITIQELANHGLFVHTHLV